MRGKLRDKHVETRRDKMKQELLARRRAIKRESRNSMSVAWLNQLKDEEDNDYLLEDDEELSLEEVKK